jgi:phospholipid/cholesterol/gamma-HCH transport system substrate-binding protein
MAQNTTETIIGGVVLAVAIGFVVFAGNIAGVSAGGNSHELHANFRSAEGISVGTDVRMAGVKIGTVTKLALNPQTYRAVAHFTVPADLVLADDTQALISTEGLLGGSFVEIVPGGGPDDLQDGSEVVQTQGAISVVTLLMKFVSGDSSK